MAAPAGPVLQGIRVADFSRVLAGPYASMMLADFGADVIKIESPAGDDTRAWLPPVDASGNSTYFASVNRNKRSVVCDLNTAEGLAKARELALSADVVIENFRPGVMEKFGLDAAMLRAERPELVYCSITGFGDGAGAALPGYDLLVQAVGGLMSITGEVDGEPSKVGVALVDVLTGLNAFSGILLALRQRDETGQGELVQVNLMSSLLSSLVNQASSTLATGTSPARFGNGHPSIAPYELLHAADREFVVAVGNDKQFAALCEVIGLAPEPRFATNPQRVANRSELREQLEHCLAANTAAHWVDALMQRGVPAGLVNTVAEAFDFATALGLEPVVEVGHAHTRLVRNPITLAANPAAYHSSPPKLGADASATWLPQERRKK